MAAILIKKGNGDAPDLFYQAGSGWVPGASEATLYPDAGAALIDGHAQREALGRTAQLAICDTLIGKEFAVPWFQT